MLDVNAKKVGAQHDAEGEREKRLVPSMMLGVNAKKGWCPTVTFNRENDMLHQFVSTEHDILPIQNYSWLF